MSSRALRAVDPDDYPPAEGTGEITSALGGSARDLLVAMRRALAIQLDNGLVSSNAIASAYKELRELDRLIRDADRTEAEEVAASGVSGDEAFDASSI